MTARPLRNRVTPLGAIVAVLQRGRLMGNRGCLHNDAGTIIRHAQRTAWISCVPTWPGVRRQLMRPGHYTELFFFDEACALAVGHRPCNSCRPLALAAFKAEWAKAHGLSDTPRVAEIDAELAATRGRLVPIDTLDDIPDGVMGTDAARTGAWLRRAGAWHQWSWDGYQKEPANPAEVGWLLTPAPIVDTIRAGFVVD